MVGPSFNAWSGPVSIVPAAPPVPAPDPVDAATIATWPAHWAEVAATRPHDYVHHGTLSLRAALNLDTGRIYNACAARNQHQEFLAFLRQLVRCFPTR